MLASKIQFFRCLYIVVLLPIMFDFSGPKDDFDLYGTVCSEICPVRCKLNSRKRGELLQERDYLPTARLQRSAKPSTVYIAISLAVC